MLLLPFSIGCSEVTHVTALQIEPNPDVATVLQVSLQLGEAADGVALQFEFEGQTLESPAQHLEAGDHTIPLLGLPPDVDVAVRVVGETDGEPWTADEGWTARTGSLPEDFPQPELVSWDAGLADSGGWLYTTVATGESRYQGPWWAYIIDREARVVWYHEVTDMRQAVMSRVSADGTHLTWGEVSWFGDPSTIERSTLDGAWTLSTEAPMIGYTYGELPDGTLAYDAWNLGSDITLRTVDPQGAVTDVWSCTEWAPEGLNWSSCGTNTVNWSEERQTFLWSLYDLATVVEIDPTTGLAVHSWGDVGADAIEPEGVGLQMQHFPNWTADGTLLLHTQEVGEERTEWAREFQVDPSSGVAEQVWSYSTTEHYADASGEAVRLPNGNTLLNYGSEGWIREIAPDGEVAWDVSTGFLVGHQTLIDDLYAVNRGWVVGL